MTARRDTGLSLLELTATLAVFALIAVMGLQALSASIRTGTRLTDLHDGTWDLAEGITLLRADLGGLAPRPFARPDGTTEPALSVDPAGARLSLSLAGRPVLPGTHETGEMRVEWRYDAGDGTLHRRAWLTLAPHSARARGPDLAVLDGIEAVAVRVLTEAGWQDRFGAAERLAALPRAIEVVLTRAGLGDLRILVAP